MQRNIVCGVANGRSALLQESAGGVSQVAVVGVGVCCGCEGQSSFDDIHSDCERYRFSHASLFGRPGRASRFISSFEFSQAFHEADGDKDKLITDDEMSILIDKVYAAAQHFVDTPEAEVRHSVRNFVNFSILFQPLPDLKFNSPSNATNATAPKPERVCKMVVEKRIRRVRLDVEPLSGEPAPECGTSCVVTQSQATFPRSMKLRPRQPGSSPLRVAHCNALTMVSRRAALTAWDNVEKAARDRAEALNSFEAYMFVPRLSAAFCCQCRSFAPLQVYDARKVGGEQGMECGDE